MHVSDSLLKKRLRVRELIFFSNTAGYENAKAHSLIKEAILFHRQLLYVVMQSTSYFICQFRRYFKTNV